MNHRIAFVLVSLVCIAYQGYAQKEGIANDPYCHEPDTFAAEAAPQWSHSLFNGLSQIIVQSTKDAGEIKLTATADGLATATSAMQTSPSTPRPFVP